jgi:hypothetical protein
MSGDRMLQKVLCVHEKYYLNNEKNGLSACNNYIYHSISGSGLVERTDFFPYDQLVRLGIEGMSGALWQKCVNEYPQVIVFYVPWHDYWEPLVKVLDGLRRLGIKVIAFYSDLVTGSVDQTRAALFKAYSLVADCLLNIDSPCLSAAYDHPCHIRGYTGVDPEHFYWRPTPRDIDVSFLGSRGQSYAARREYIAFLERNLAEREIHFLVGGGQLPEEESLSLADYADLLRHSKITLNFATTLGNVRQLKGRVLEALACRTFLLDEANPGTRRLFSEGSDYVSFDNKEELLTKILYYLENAGEREQIADSGWVKARDLWNARNLWAYVFTKLGFDIASEAGEHFAEFCKLMDGVQAGVRREA